MNILKNDWADILNKEFNKPYYLELSNFLEEEYSKSTIYPEREDIFNAFHNTTYSDVKVVILGQDPYHGEGQAHGLSFSVKHGITIPRSLNNIFKELQNDLGCYIPNNGYLHKWSQEGVLLLNTVLTVRQANANSHKGKGWEKFTNKVISVLNTRKKPIIFILWGKNAQEKEILIDTSKHYIIKSTHPSPFSANRGFFGSKPFSQANKYLVDMGDSEIDWQIPNI